MKYLKLRTFDDVIHATLARGVLENNGIPCFLTNENVTTLLPSLNFIHGGGIHLMVGEENFERAAELLSRDADALAE